MIYDAGGKILGRQIAAAIGGALVDTALALRVNRKEQDGEEQNAQGKSDFFSGRGLHSWRLRLDSIIGLIFKVRAFTVPYHSDPFVGHR